MTTLDERTVTVVPDDAEPVECAYRVAGDGPPLVLLHGIGIDAAAVSWRDVFPKLARDFTVYALDLPGHGESEKPRVRYTTAYFRRALAAFLDELGLRGASVAGISMGGGVALAHALDGGDPERLVLVDSYGLGGDAFWRPGASALLRAPLYEGVLWGSVAHSKRNVRRAIAAMTAGPGADPALVDDVYETACQRGAIRTMCRWQRDEFGVWGFRTNNAGRLADLDVPTLLVHGARDPLVPLRWSERAYERIPESQLHVLEESGHWGPREEPAATAAATRSFLGA